MHLYGLLVMDVHCSYASLEEPWLAALASHALSAKGAL